MDDASPMIVPSGDAPLNNSVQDTDNVESSNPKLADRNDPISRNSDENSADVEVVDNPTPKKVTLTSEMGNGGGSVEVACASVNSLPEDVSNGEESVIPLPSEPGTSDTSAVTNGPSSVLSVVVKMEVPDHDDDYLQETEQQFIPVLNIKQENTSYDMAESTSPLNQEEAACFQSDVNGEADSDVQESSFSLIPLSTVKVENMIPENQIKKERIEEPCSSGPASGGLSETPLVLNLLPVQKVCNMRATTAVRGQNSVLNSGGGIERIEVEPKISAFGQVTSEEQTSPDKKPDSIFGFYGLNNHVLLDKMRSKLKNLIATTSLREVCGKYAYDRDRKPFLCSVCGRLFTTKGHLHVHSRIHSRQVIYKCEHCGKHFYSRSRYEAHGKFYCKKDLFTCGQCGESFNGKAVMDKHLRTHVSKRKNGGKRRNRETFICDDCGRICASKQSLGIHIERTHLGEGPFSCVSCKEMFCTRSDFVIHRRRHFVPHE